MIVVSWEYRLVNSVYLINSDLSEFEFLGEVGREGWELVCIKNYPMLSPFMPGARKDLNRYYYLKRPGSWIDHKGELTTRDKYEEEGHEL